MDRRWPAGGLPSETVTSSEHSPQDKAAGLAHYIDARQRDVEARRVAADAPAADQSASALTAASASLSPRADVAELDAARQDSQELGVSVPDPMTGATLTMLAAAATAGVTGASAIAITPALAVVGHYLLDGMPAGTLTCIDPEAAHQELARNAFRRRGLPTSRARFLTSRPLDVLGRMAPGSYQLIYAEVDPLELATLVDTALPLLAPGGSLLLADCLYGGELDDPERDDRSTVAARRCQDALDDLDGVAVCRLALGAGMAVVTRLH